mmetsp:Transcript_13935/g.20069  ORF Transcript_13935/g.20069 Transcript_13935/m.20069 type:complete len:468 (-) Transcript_13935:279-1682(-)|eukprot:CAMPEP_0202447972 /NCGR_PEP_ID=MMETSP1360-20130828/6745_1 /ASSEMBLY_ACC=CAM_ASM_000848 /TAXON_ID=515479 /ORGANISM="Licmophora paradoxa, Strain CCMP2313" /LENGTH=467 /DNA_ID=CAMNT_0049065309 /DNA_START=838 /DNA_END=2241 /DNA_ORIENTATION=+
MSSKRLYVATRCRGEDEEKAKDVSGEEYAKGTKLEYGHDGNLRGATSFSMNYGTSVAIVKFLDAFPEQRRALRERIHIHTYNIFTMMQACEWIICYFVTLTSQKRSFYAYTSSSFIDAILCLGVSFNLIEIDERRQEKLKLRTRLGLSTVSETISSVLGTHFLSGLSSFDLDLSPPSTALPSRAPTATTTKAIHHNNHRLNFLLGQVTVKGYVSKASQRSSRNFQFYSINGKPVDLPILAKVLNDEWASVGMSQCPAAVLQLTIPHYDNHNRYSEDLSVILTMACPLIGEAVAALWKSQTEELELCEHPLLMNSSSSSNTKSMLETRGALGDNFFQATESNEFAESSPRRRVQRRMAFVHDLDNATIPDQTETVHIVSPMMKERSPINISSPSFDRMQQKSHNNRSYIEKSASISSCSNTSTSTPKRTISSIDLYCETPDNAKKQRTLNQLASEQFLEVRLTGLDID